MGPARRYWLLPLAWACIIFALSSIPGGSMPPVPGLQYDKVVHGLVYAVLGGLCFLALRHTWSLSRARLVGLAAGFAVLYGASDEFHQMFVPGRSPEILDALADGIGGLLGASIASMFPLSGPGSPG